MEGTLMPERRRYRAPNRVEQINLRDGLILLNRAIAGDKQLDLLRSGPMTEVPIHFAGDFQILKRPAVSIVGTREVSPDGFRRASRLARELVEAGVVVVSGLARGVDTAALTAAVEARGSVAAVIGTPLSKAYPAENAWLQEQIYEEHLLVTPFAEGEPVFKGNFPKRNRVMALLSDATVIIEASDTSGTLHQAAECVRQGRWLFILQSVVADPRLEWPKNFLDKDKVCVLSHTSEIVERVRRP
jgi:DNA processing protein